MKQFLVLILITVLFSCTAGKKYKASSNSIVRINIGSRRLTSLPDSVFQKPGLTDLWAGHSGWVSIPPLGGTSDPVDRNRIRFLPDKLCQIKTLKKLNLAFNNIEILPDCFASLQNLECLDLSFNLPLKIRQCIPIIKSLKNLKELNLYRVPEAFIDSSWVRQQFAGRNLLLTITNEDCIRHYGPNERDFTQGHITQEELASLLKKRKKQRNDLVWKNSGNAIYYELKDKRIIVAFAHLDFGVKFESETAMLAFRKSLPD